jgi:hypothetical protein
MQEHYAALGVEAILLTMAASTASALLFAFTAMVMCADKKKVYKNKGTLRDQPPSSLPQFIRAPPQPPASMSDKLSSAPLPSSKISDRTRPSASGSRRGRSRKDASGDPTTPSQSSRRLSGSNRSDALPYPKSERYKPDYSFQPPPQGFHRSPAYSTQPNIVESCWAQKRLEREKCNTRRKEKEEKYMDLAIYLQQMAAWQFQRQRQQQAILRQQAVFGNFVGPGYAL